MHGLMLATHPGADVTPCFVRKVFISFLERLDNVLRERESVSEGPAVDILSWIRRCFESEGNFRKPIRVVLYRSLSWAWCHIIF